MNEKNETISGSKRNNVSDSMSGAKQNRVNADRRVAIRLSGVKKQYRLGTIGGRTLQAELQSWWAKKCGKEDPNVRIGVDTRLIGQKFMALNGIDLTVYQGERLGIIGANGAGKSTMLKLLSRVTAPTEGEIDLYGRVSSMLEVGTGFHGEMTGRENIYMNGAILGMTKAQIDERIEDIIDFSEVREFIDTPVKRYSSGMFVKLAFSVAAHLNSNIMIMDEVLAVGDMAFQTKCLDKMREAADTQGRTILYVSHNMNTIRKLCERCIVMDQGRIIFDGDVEQAIALYMDHGLGENPVDIDLTDRSLAAKGVDTGLAMKHLLLVDKVSPSYENGEVMKLRVDFETTKPLKEIKLRATLTNDGELSLGSVWSQGLTMEEPGRYSCEVGIPLEHLMKGTFYVDLCFCEVTDIGGNRALDHIARAFRFEMPGVLVWNTHARGYMKFAEATAKIIKI